MSPRMCGLCKHVVDDLITHIQTPEHQAALRAMLDSPLTERDPRDNKGYKDQPERRKTDKEKKEGKSHDRRTFKW